MCSVHRSLGRASRSITRSSGYATLFFILFLGWALVDNGRPVLSSLFCLTAVKLPFSKATFKKKKKKKDDIYQSLLSGDLGGREKGRVYCLWKQAQKMKKTCREGNAFRPQSCQNNYGEMALGLGIANLRSAHSPLSTSASSPARSHR